MVTPSTAFTWSTVWRSTPRLMGNHTFRFSASMTTGAPAAGAGGFPLGSASIRCFVYGCFGASKISRAVPCSTMSPSFITQTRSAILRTMLRSWVMKRIPSPRVLPEAVEEVEDPRRWTVTSSADVGSSAMSSLGLAAMAIAMSTRCNCPPESSCG